MRGPAPGAEIEEFTFKFTFRDFRHTAINNWRLQGHDYFRIMAATGHKPLNVFKLDNTMRKEELKALVRENRWGYSSTYSPRLLKLTIAKDNSLI